jgi:GT2 family glycosyltransferase
VRILMLMPLYKHMDAHCVISLLDFVQNITNDGHKPKITFTNGFNAAKARKALMLYAAEHSDEFDYVLWLDSDHVYKTENLYKLIDRMKAENLKMLSATYTLHGSSETAHGTVENGKFRHFEQKDFGESVIDCTVVGFGFLVMTSQFAKEMHDKFGEKLFILDAKENCTEDVRFCRCVLDSGERVCFDPMVKVGHIELAVRY